MEGWGFHGKYVEVGAWSLSLFFLLMSSKSIPCQMAGLIINKFKARRLVSLIHLFVFLAFGETTVNLLLKAKASFTLISLILILATQIIDLSSPHCLFLRYNQESQCKLPHLALQSQGLGSSSMTSLLTSSFFFTSEIG